MMTCSSHLDSGYDYITVCINVLLFVFIFFTGLGLNLISKDPESPCSYSGGTLAELPGLLLLHAPVLTQPQKAAPK